MPLHKAKELDVTRGGQQTVAKNKRGAVEKSAGAITRTEFCPSVNVTIPVLSTTDCEPADVSWI